MDKAFTFGTMKLIPSMDIFNLTNTSTVMPSAAGRSTRSTRQRRGLVVVDASAEPDQRHPRAARHPVRAAGHVVRQCNAEC